MEGGFGGWDVRVIVPVPTRDARAISPIYFAPPVGHNDQEVANNDGQSCLMNEVSEYEDRVGKCDRTST
jgi:hypothetical protein